MYSISIAAMALVEEIFDDVLHQLAYLIVIFGYPNVLHKILAIGTMI